MSKNIICMIPARIGSNRLKYKNLAILNGKPLIAHSILSAKKSKIFTNIIINSDHNIFSEIASNYNINFFLRDKKLGTSKIKSDAVVYNFLKFNYLSEGILVWLNPICPMIDSKTIKNTVNYFKKKKLASLITSTPKSVHSMFKTKPINFNINQKFDLTQDLIPVEIFNYGIMMWDIKKFISKFEKKQFAFFINPFSTYQINEMESLIVKNQNDLLFCELAMQSKRKNYQLKYDKILKNI